MLSRVLWARFVFAALFLIVSYLTITPNTETVEQGFDIAEWFSAMVFRTPEFGDKIAHFAAYGALGASALWAQLLMFGKKRWTPLLLAAYGAALEGVQAIGGVRSPELLDSAANALGAMAGFGGAFLLCRLLTLKQRRSGEVKRTLDN